MDRLAQHLVSRGLLPAERVEEAVRRQAISGGSLDTVLLEQGAISEAGALQAISDITGYRLVNLADFEPNREVASFIPPKIAERLCVVPLSVEGTALHVACSYPVPSKELEEVSFLLNKRLELWVALEVRIRDWIAAIYGLSLSQRDAALLAALDPNRPLPAAVLSPPTPTVPTETTTLEDSLNREMVEQLAESVVNEPIPLEVRKKPADPAPPPPPPPSPPPARNQLSTSTWDRVETTTLDVSQYAAFAKASVQVEAKPAPRPAPEKVAPPPVAPMVPPKADGRKATEPAFPIAAVEVKAPAPRREPPPPAPPAQPPPAPDEREAVASWTLSDARAQLKGATQDRNQIIDVALRYARQTFDFVAAFAVVRGNAVGWDTRGEGADVTKLQQISIPLDAASVFRTVALTRGSYVGPLPPDALTKHFLGLMGRSPRTALLFPVEVKARMVAILYGDSGTKPVSQRRLSDLILFCQDLPGAFQELILFKKQRDGASGAFVDPEPAAPVRAGLGWAPNAAASLPGLGRAASFQAPILPEDERPPPDFGPVLKRLTGPDAASRARAIAELARSPEASAKVLIENFPGPTGWSRLPVVELPEAEELGPIPGALARLGRPAAQALAPLLDADDPDTRYFALLTAGNLPYLELVDGVLRGLFDLEPDISSAARAAASAFRNVPRFDGSMRSLRQELAAVDSLRRTLAARALGVLHDREAIDGLIGLTGSSDQMCAQAAAEALREITKATWGTQPRAWSAWWAENRNRPRAYWLVAALRHADFDVRLSAIEELSKALNTNLGYFADAPAGERDAALRQWETALQSNERLRRLG